MKQRIIYIALLSAIVLSGCSKRDVSSDEEVEQLNSEVGTISNSPQEYTSLAEIFGSKSGESSDISNTQPSKENSNSENSSNKTGKEDVKNEMIKNMTEESSIISPKADASNDYKPNLKEPEQGPYNEKNDNEASNEPAIAQPDFNSHIVNYIEELLNTERNKSGATKRQLLKGLNKIAIYRSEQITKQFSHIWVDENNKSWQASDYAAAHFKYGKHSVINETRYDAVSETVIETGNVIEIYSYGGYENIAKGGVYSNNAEEIAKYIVTVFKSSKNHWNSLMSKDELYDGIGVTISGEYWYCSINSSEINYG